MKQQLDTHKEALHSLYGSYDKLRQQYRSLCNVVCNQLDDTESYMNQRKEQTNLLQTREKEIFVLWDKLKQLEDYKQKCDAIMSNVKKPHYEKDERNEFEEDEERKYVKRVKSDDSQLNLRNSKEFDLSPMSNGGNRSPLKRKHNETSATFDPSSSLSPFPIPDTEQVSHTETQHFDETTLVSMNKPHRSQDDLFYQNNSSKGFGVAVDFLLPHTSPGPSSHFQNKEAMMLLGGSSNEDEEVENDGVILQQSSDSLQKEDENQNEHEHEDDRDEDENKNIISDDFFDDQKGDEDEDFETTTSLHLEDFQQSPIHPLPSSDAISDVDSVDSLYGLQAMLSPTVPTPSPSSVAPPKTISQNLFGSDRSSAEKKSHFLMQDTSFEISSDKEGFSSRGEEDSASIFRTSSQPPSSTLPPSRKKQVEFAEISIQTEELLEEVRAVQTVAVPVQSRFVTISTQTDVRPLRDEGTQASTRSILLREAEINTEITGSIHFQPPSSSSSASKKKVDQIVEVNFPAASNSVVKGWSSVDQEYLDEMETVQYQLGERLIELELEKEQALNELKKNMKSNILSSINQRPVTTLSPPSQRESAVTASSRVALPASIEKDKIDKEKQKEEKDRLQQDKDILEKKLFTLQEKIRYLEREKKEYQDTININQSSYQTEKDIQEVKLKELEAKNKQLIQMISEIRVRKGSSDAAIQTEKRQKTSKPRVINLTNKIIGEQEDEVEADDEDEDDELSRLLFQENYPLSNPSRQQHSVGKMEAYKTTSAVTVNPEVEISSRSGTYNSSSINLDSSVHSAIFPTSLESTIVIENSLLADHQQKRSVADSDASAILLNTSVRQPMKKTDLARVSQVLQEFEEYEDEENDETSMTSYSVEEKSSIADTASSSILVQERTSYYTPPLPPHTSSIPPPPPMIPATPPQFHTGFVNYYHHPGTTSNGFSNSEDDESNRNFIHDGITFASSGSLIMSKDADDISSTASLPPAVTGIGISRSGSYEDYLNQQFQQFESDMDREIAAVINDGGNGTGVNNSTLDQSRIGPAQGIAFSQDFSEEDEAEDTHLDRLLIEEDENDEYALAKNTMKEVEKYLTAADNREQNTENSLKNEILPVEDYEVKQQSLQYQEEKQQSAAPKKSEQFSSSFVQRNHEDDELVRKDRSISSTGGVDGGVNLESFELMRLEWENQQLSSKQNDLVRENQVSQVTFNLKFSMISVINPFRNFFESSSFIVQKSLQ